MAEDALENLQWSAEDARWAQACRISQAKGQSRKRRLLPFFLFSFFHWNIRGCRAAVNFYF
jgi:hypothetical protein